MSDDMLQTQMHNLPQGAAARIVTATFQHVHCQSHKQPDRSVIYKVLEVCIQKRSEGGLCYIHISLVIVHHFFRYVYKIVKSDR